MNTSWPEFQKHWSLSTIQKLDAEIQIWLWMAQSHKNHFSIIQKWIRYYQRKQEVKVIKFWKGKMAGKQSQSLGNWHLCCSRGWESYVCLVWERRRTRKRDPMMLGIGISRCLERIVASTGRETFQCLFIRGNHVYVWSFDLNERFDRRYCPAMSWNQLEKVPSSKRAEEFQNPKWILWNAIHALSMKGIRYQIPKTKRNPVLLTMVSIEIAQSGQGI